MININRIINNLKILTSSKTDAELSQKLGLGQKAVAVWKSRNSLNLQKIIEFALENNYSLDLIFKEDLLDNKNISIKDPFEEFVFFYLKKIKKLDRNSFLNILFNPTMNLLTRCLKQFENENIFFSKTNSKEVLLNLIQKCNLNFLIDSEIKRKKLLEEIEEEFSNLECYVILKFRDKF